MPTTKDRSLLRSEIQRTLDFSAESLRPQQWSQIIEHTIEPSFFPDQNYLHVHHVRRNYGK